MDQEEKSTLRVKISVKMKSCGQKDSTFANSAEEHRILFEIYLKIHSMNYGLNTLNLYFGYLGYTERELTMARQQLLDRESDGDGERFTSDVHKKSYSYMAIADSQKRNSEMCPG